MTLNEARLIRDIKKRSTYRYLAEVWYSKSEPGHGNQGYGQDLCKEALEILYPGKDIWRLGNASESIQFDCDNMSYLGEFYWWE